MANIAMRAFGYAYRRLRPLVPGGIIYAGVVSCYDRPWSDYYVPRSWLPLGGVVGDEPEYEAALCRGLREHVRVGDRVVIVGAGIGITAVVAAQCGGIVRCYEGSLEQVRLARKTIRRNSVEVAVEHAVVGDAVGVYGIDVGPILAVGQLPECDVLEMDCEGAELSILRDMVIRPRVVLVETHGNLGASSSEVAVLLGRLGYNILDYGLAEPRIAETCTLRDVRVLLGLWG